MKKKKYVQPECDIVYSYDLESELMYGNGLDGGGMADLGFPTGSGGGSGSGGGNLGGEDDTDDSDRAKGNNIWGVSWDY